MKEKLAWLLPKKAIVLNNFFLATRSAKSDEVAHTCTFVLNKCQHHVRPSQTKPSQTELSQTCVYHNNSSTDYSHWPTGRKAIQASWRFWSNSKTHNVRVRAEGYTRLADKQLTVLCDEVK
ncbi:unnamed protein product [Ceratitis capitata]|uniref:(Mediterranean fruit fly) hypothetical protein n=1 Tax=Ceratitis capitata TaxID=7213 RepID=A0A811UMZ2_CERCA|nr:unnamed protein product [Ceratitis capitata]